MMLVRLELPLISAAGTTTAENETTEIGRSHAAAKIIIVQNDDGDDAIILCIFCGFVVDEREETDKGSAVLPIAAVTVSADDVGG
jgi:hypothetical protein